MSATRLCTLVSPSLPGASCRRVDPTRRVQRVQLFLRSFVLYRPWIPGEHCRTIRAVECVTAHLRGFEEDSRSEINLTFSTGTVISVFVCTVHAFDSMQTSSRNTCCCIREENGTPCQQRVCVRWCHHLCLVLPVGVLIVLMLQFLVSNWSRTFGRSHEQCVFPFLWVYLSLVFRGIGLPGRAVLRYGLRYFTGTRFRRVHGHRPPEVCKKPLVPSGIEGICPSWLHGDDGGAGRLLYAVHQVLSLWSLYRCGSWSPRPQPLGSGGDTTPCEDTRGDHESFF